MSRILNLIKNMNWQKLAIVETLKKGFKLGGKWETAFCQKCGKDFDGFHSFCDTCKRILNLKKF